jgi:hypothetical protein
MVAAWSDQGAAGAFRQNQEAPERIGQKRNRHGNRTGQKNWCCLAHQTDPLPLLGRPFLVGALTHALISFLAARNSAPTLRRFATASAE